MCSSYSYLSNTISLPGSKLVEVDGTAAVLNFNGPQRACLGAPKEALTLSAPALLRATIQVPGGGAHATGKAPQQATQATAAESTERLGWEVRVAPKRGFSAP